MEDFNFFPQLVFNVAATSDLVTLNTHTEYKSRIACLPDVTISLTDKTRMPSPQTPLPERARGFENLQLFLAPLLLLWEKGLGDEGKRFVSQSA
jgi:hypothetical protein